MLANHIYEGPYIYIYIKRICDLDEVFERRLDDLRGFLVSRGYEKDFVENQFSRAREVDRCNLFDRGEKKSRVLELIWLLITIPL